MVGVVSNEMRAAIDHAKAISTGGGMSQKRTKRGAKRKPKPESSSGRRELSPLVDAIAYAVQCDQKRLKESRHALLIASTVLERQTSVGAVWRPVRRIALRRGEHYFIRRTWKNKAPELPCLAQWEYGWTFIWGDVPPTTAVGADIEVFTSEIEQMREDEQ